MGGICIALLFRVDRRPTAAPSLGEDPGIALRGDGSGGIVPPAPLPMSVDRTTPRGSTRLRPTTTVLTPLNQPSPELSPSYPGDDPLVRAGWNLPPELGMPRETSAGEPAVCWHRVADGDTLEEIARRYLGNKTRARDIFTANRDRLDDPKLLPIGVRLRIPVN